MMLLTVENMWKSFDDFVALRDIDIHVEDGEIVAILGPSGSGKSTLLRCIAGLEQPERGTITFDGKVINKIPTHVRGFGLMFQQFALFPHRNVFENVAFGLRMQDRPADAIDARVQDMLALVGLDGYQDRDVAELSGGEQQRVALARSLAPSPQLLLLDEPLGSLDRTLRERLMDEIRRILKEIGVTALYVTHDQQEAFAVSDRLLLLNEGEVVQEGRPEEIYRRPATEFAARFLGLSNLLPAQVLSATADTFIFDTSVGHFEMQAVGAIALEPDDSAILVIRPEAATLSPGDQVINNLLTGVVIERSFRGGHYRVTVEHESEREFEFEIATPDRDIPHVGEEISLHLRDDAMWIICG